MTTIKDAFQFGIEPALITNTDNIQVSEQTATEPQVYALQLAKTVKAMLNAALQDAESNIPFPIELLPTRNSLPTPIIAHTLADRSVVVPMGGGKAPAVVTAAAGTEITVEPIEQAVLVSYQTKLWDAKTLSGFTAGTLQQDALNICESVVRSINSKMVDVLMTSRLVKTHHEVPVTTGKMVDYAESLLDGLYAYTEPSLGASLSDYGILMHENELRALGRLAASKGFGGEDAIKDMLGTDIAYYNGSDRGAFMLSKRFTALSFGCLRTDGEHINVVLSRDGNSQSHDLEIRGKVHVVAEPAATIKMGTGSVNALLFVVQRLVWDRSNP